MAMRSLLEALNPSTSETLLLILSVRVALYQSVIIAIHCRLVTLDGTKACSHKKASDKSDEIVMRIWMGVKFANIVSHSWSPHCISAIDFNALTASTNLSGPDLKNICRCNWAHMEITLARIWKILRSSSAILDWKVSKTNKACKLSHAFIAVTSRKNTDVAGPRGLSCRFLLSINGRSFSLFMLLLHLLRDRVPYPVIWTE